MMAHGVIRGIMERADHAGEITQRAALNPALAQRPAGFSFKINDEEILAGVQNMAEMQISMTANTQGGHGCLMHRTIPRQDGILQSQHFFRERTDGLRQFFLLTAQHPEMKREMIEQRLLQ